MKYTFLIFTLQCNSLPLNHLFTSNKKKLSAGLQDSGQHSTESDLLLVTLTRTMIIFVFVCLHALYIKDGHVF